MKKIVGGIVIICLITCILFGSAAIGFKTQANAHARVNVDAYGDYMDGAINWTDFQFETTHYGVLANINHAFYELCSTIAGSLAVACIIFFVFWLLPDEDKKKDEKKK